MFRGQVALGWIENLDKNCTKMAELNFVMSYDATVLGEYEFDLLNSTNTQRNASNFNSSNNKTPKMIKYSKRDCFRQTNPRHYSSLSELQKRKTTSIMKLCRMTFY